MGEVIGVAVDLDEVVPPNFRGRLTQDYTDVHAKCEVTFTYPVELDFVDGIFFVWMDHVWEATSYRRSAGDGQFNYSISGFPAGSYGVVKGLHRNIEELAGGAGIPFAEGSDNLPIKFPLHGIRLGPLLRRYRYRSFEENLGDPGRAWFLYYDSRGLVSSTFAGLRSASALSLDLMDIREIGGTYQFIREYPEMLYRRDPAPFPVSYETLSRAVVGDLVEVMVNNIYGYIGTRFTLSGDKDIEKMENLVLLRQDFDTGADMKWTLTFGNIEV